MLITLKDCDIVAVERQRNCDFGCACFAQCRFSGVFSGIDVGHPDSATWHPNFGKVDGCDISAATLYDSRAINTDAGVEGHPQQPGDHDIRIEHQPLWLVR